MISGVLFIYLFFQMEVRIELFLSITGQIVTQAKNYCYILPKHHLTVGLVLRQPENVAKYKSSIYLTLIINLKAQYFI